MIAGYHLAEALRELVYPYAMGRWDVIIVPGNHAPRKSGSPALSRCRNGRWKIVKRSTLHVSVGMGWLIRVCPVAVAVAVLEGRETIEPEHEEIEAIPSRLAEQNWLREATSRLAAQLDEWSSRMREWSFSPEEDELYA